MGIGFPANTGGAAQFMTGYAGRTAPVGEIGLAAFVARADELAEEYGDRFRPTAYLRDLAATGGSVPGLSGATRASRPGLLSPAG